MNTVYYHESMRSRKVLQADIPGDLPVEDIMTEFNIEHPRAHPLGITQNGAWLWTAKEDLILSQNNSD